MDQAAAQLRQFADKVDTAKVGPPAVLGVITAHVFLAIGHTIVGLTTTSGQVNAFSRVLFALLLVVGLSNFFGAATGSVGWGSDQVIGLVASVV
ncbi:MAG: hypothetical protein B7X41_08235 [Microbacterium sp. 14-71-5]|nr:MAG: hypothetical protein B7X41_08235 [Microbacterium sp. 14-71-5]